jgi:hypothetical protein
MADTKPESKAEVQGKYERALARIDNMRKEMDRQQEMMLDGAFTIAGGVVGGLICKEWGPYGEGSGDAPINLISGLVMTAIGVSEVAGKYSSEIAAFGVGQLAFQGGLWVYGDGYKDDSVQGYPDEVGYDEEVGYAPRRRRSGPPSQRARMHNEERAGLPARSRAAMTFERIQQLLREGQPLAA